MAESLICIKSENSRNFQEVYRKQPQTWQQQKLDDRKQFSLSAEHLRHVTRYHCFLTRKEIEKGLLKEYIMNNH